MKKFFISVLLSTLLFLATGVTAFAANQVVSDMTFGGNAVKLSSILAQSGSCYRGS